MIRKILTPKVLVVMGVILFAAIMRLVPHYPNFTPVGALALFAGAHLANRWLAFSIPIAALLVSDILLGFHDMMIPVYVSFVLMVAIGGLFRNNIRVLTVGGGALAGSLVFFLLTNLAVWMSGTMYPTTLSGLVQCYVAAIPFFHMTILGDLFYSGVFFGGFYLVQQYYPAVRQA
ncbi:MAG TPA: DUF6580 family putative transport protein [Bacteroidales bacterium]|nr:DUF6580 family putative transport protein [Bacteroidales bacterium]